MAALKTLVVALLCMLMAAPSLHAQMSCGQMVNKLTPCIDYLMNGGAVPSNCCAGVTALYSTATTTPNRQAICKCLKSALGSVSYSSNNLKNAQALPGKCGVKIPYKISPNLKCETIRRF
ncbi:hypothetical protein QQ045_005785 [Rhodiola kirilowii]